ncbi:HNH endonuclease signature motif containing protein [Arthrobacter sp. zg-Y844]|uniref:HNH endonuclease signature motif containing protein n=1 Tax=Arthrobacter sp. zg-Y844 TaxID=2964612 RepID=UPI002107E8F7|nr:HNH endonuclease signature motif containing protein [Arthrobacter sp. zg-Y844]MCQ1986865.1 HNH endonuclease [Arthrobacter sp. zg-Y844]
MDHLGNTERTIEEPGSERPQPEGMAGEGDAPRAACTLAVYRAELDAEPDADGAAQVGSPDAEYPDGFTGTLALQNLEAFDEQTVGEALSRMAHLMSWVQALQARLINRMEEIFREDFRAASGRLEPGMAFSLAASECAAILNIPQVTAQRMMFEADRLCSTHTATLTALEEGQLSYQHVQVVLDQCLNVPPDQLPEFEADLLAAAAGQTRAQFSCKARRLRERKFPETISKRHLTAFEQRKVTLDREEDGMSCLSAHLRAAEAQQIYTALSTAAWGEQSAGDSRTADQLRSDILAQLLMGSSRGLFAAAGTQRGAGTRNRAGHAEDSGCFAGGGDTGDDTGGATQRNGDIVGSEGTNVLTTGPDEGIIPRTEIMVLINAETLFGADDQPAELHGYGPISAEAARRLARNAVGWTGLAQDPHTGEILGVGRRRKVPAGLRRWLRARDGTCRFPGCRVSTANSDVDHTIDWAQGGPTDHGNLEHLCRRHHRFKTLGYWKACQPEPGVIEWTSPTGRVYRTEPFLELGPPDAGPGPGTGTGTGTDFRQVPQTDAVLQDDVLQDSLPEQAPPF